ncbi:MAG: hypothetical protein QM658_05040 [Gordonia sp. (in: high G+C Gram-positive bacteria)]
MPFEIDDDLRDELTRRWSEPHRRHHDLNHLNEVLAALATLHDDGLAFAARPVVLAAWFHDAVYEPLGADNEGASADLARARLAGDPDVDEVVRLVEMTRSHQAAADDRNGIALSDADLAVLGASAGRYDAYSAAVCDEYREVPEEAFRAGRAAILSDFLSRDRLFASEEGRARWESAARENIAREIGALRSGS